MRASRAAMIRAICETSRTGSRTCISVIGTISHPSPNRSRLRSQSAAPRGAPQGAGSYEGRQGRVVLVAVGLEPGVNLGVPDVRVPPAPVGELHGVLEVWFGQEAGLVRVEGDLLEPALEAAVDVAAAPPALLQYLQETPASFTTIGAERIQAVEQQAQRYLALGEHVVHDRWCDVRHLERHVDHRAGQRRHRDPAAMRAVD